MEKEKIISYIKIFIVLFVVFTGILLIINVWFNILNKDLILKISYTAFIIVIVGIIAIKLLDNK